MKINKTSIVFVLGAVVSAVVAAYLADQYIATTISDQKARIDAQYKPVKVIVAKHDLSIGSTLDGSTLGIRGVPSGFVHKDALRPEDFDSINGHRILHPVNKGETILTQHISKAKSNTFSALVKEGKRALTFPVDRISSVSGMLAPGDTIDLLATIDKKGKSATFPLLKGVNIMATGQDIGTNDIDNSRQYQTVTLMVTSEEAMKIIHARQLGSLTVVLRSPTDELDEAIQIVTLDTIMGLEKTQKRKVDMIIGGK